MKIYENVTEVILMNDDVEVSMNAIMSFQDRFDEIKIECADKIDNLNRGWLGDITYVISGINLNDNKKITDTCCIKDALLIRVNTSCDSSSPMTWGYTFLKY